MNRKTRANLARETISIIEQGFYKSSGNQTIQLRDDLEKCRRGTVMYENEDTFSRELAAENPNHLDSSIEVTRETTLESVFRLKKQLPGKHIACLNFASANNPGGGFLNGSLAQEESLARSSGLYASIMDKDRYYGYHRQLRTALYSDRMIFSPNVPFFREDDGGLMDPYYLISVITSPAVNTGALKKNEPDKIDRIIPTMYQRMLKVLLVATQNGVEGLVLGAWGCGVFQNDPREMAQLWFEILVKSNSFNRCIPKVVFAVPGKATDNYNAFSEVLSGIVQQESII